MCNFLQTAALCGFRQWVRRQASSSRQNAEGHAAAGGRPGAWTPRSNCWTLHSSAHFRPHEGLQAAHLPPDPRTGWRDRHAAHPGLAWSVVDPNGNLSAKSDFPLPSLCCSHPRVSRTAWTWATAWGSHGLWGLAQAHVGLPALAPPPRPLFPHPSCQTHPWPFFCPYSP